MKHRVAGRKLGRTSAHRLAVLRSLSTSLFRHERIRTTLMKAKELRPFAERLITVGKRGDVTARRRVARQIHDRDVAKKLVDTLATRFAERPGGYTRIVKLGPRRGDAAEMALIELIGSELVIGAKEEAAPAKPKGRLGRVRERLTRRRAGARDAKAAESAGAPSEPAAPKTRGKKGSARKASSRKSAGRKTGSRRSGGSES